jgi:hypothetical protein
MLSGDRAPESAGFPESEHFFPDLCGGTAVSGFLIRTNFSFPFELSHLIAGMPYRAPIDKDRVFATMFNAPPGGATVE